MNRELLLFVSSLWFGAVLAIVYDVLRIWRNVYLHRQWLISAEDTLYWCGCAVAIFRKLYQENNGEIRIYTIGAMILGMILYSKIISEFLVKWISQILNRIKKILKIPLNGGRLLINRLKHCIVGIKISVYRYFSLKKKRKVKNEGKSKERKKRKSKKEEE